MFPAKSKSPPEAASSSWASTTIGLPFFDSSPTESRATPGPLDAEHGAGEGGAEMGELDQVLGARLGRGADVEHEHRAPAARRAGELDRERRPLDAAQALDPEGRRRHRRAGRPGADERVGVARRRRRRRRATTEASGRERTAGSGLVVVGDRLGRLDQLDAGRRPRSSPSSAVRPKTRSADPLGGGGPSAVDDRRGALRRRRARRGRPVAAGPPAALAAIGYSSDSAPGSSGVSWRDRPHARRRCRRSGRPGAAAAGCGTAGTRSGAARDTR